jgi:hypothetical protein
MSGWFSICLTGYGRIPVRSRHAIVTLPDQLRLRSVVVSGKGERGGSGNSHLLFRHARRFPARSAALSPLLPDPSGQPVSLALSRPAGKEPQRIAPFAALYSRGTAVTIYAAPLLGVVPRQSCPNRLFLRGQIHAEWVMVIPAAPYQSYPGGDTATR